MDLEELRTVREQERRTDSLQHLRDSFYDDATEYVRELKRERSRRAKDAGDPYAPEAMRLTDEIDTAAEVIESLYERRRGKVVKLASFAAAGMPAEKDGMTEQERTMFGDLVERIEANEEKVLGKLEDIDVEGEATGVPSADPPAVTGADTTPDAGTSSDAAEATDEEPTHVIGDPTATDADSEPGTPTTADAAAPEDPVPAETAPTAGSSDPTEAVGATTESESESATESPPEGRPGGSDDLGTAPESSGDGGILADAMGGESPDTTDSAASNGAGVTGEAGATGGTAGGSTSAGATDAQSPAEAADPTDSTDRPTGEAAVATGSPDTSAESSSDDGVSDDSPTAGGAANGTSSTTTETPPTDQTATETPSTERTTVRVTTAVGEIFGVDDRSYDLQTDDIVHLPTANAEPLVQQDAAEPLE